MFKKLFCRHKYICVAKKVYMNGKVTRILECKKCGKRKEVKQ